MADEYKEQTSINTWRRPDDLIYKFLTVDGLGSDPAMNKDGSVTPINFDFICTARCRLQTLNIFIQDNAMSADVFAGLGSALANGLLVEIRDNADTLLLDPTDGVPIQTNASWAPLTGPRVIFFDESGMQEDLMTWDWELDKSGAGLWLDKDSYIRIKVQDDLTGITVFRCMVHGVTL